MWWAAIRRFPRAVHLSTASVTVAGLGFYQVNFTNFGHGGRTPSNFVKFSNAKSTKEQVFVPEEESGQQLSLQLTVAEIEDIIDRFQSSRNLENNMAAGGAAALVLLDVAMLTGSGLFGLLVSAGLCVRYVYKHLEPVGQEWRQGDPLRLRFIDIPDDILGMMGVLEARKIKKKNLVLASDHRYTLRVQRIGRAIAQASEVILPLGLSFSFQVIDDDELNAFVLPSGNCFVNRGLVEALTEEELAVVLSHEIAHLAAKHAGEQLSMGRFPQILTYAYWFIGQFGLPIPTDPQSTAAINLASNVLLKLPFSRLHELEADRIGLTYMVGGCLNPSKAATLWDKMEALKAGQNVPAWLSTHPQNQERGIAINTQIPQLLHEYQRKCVGLPRKS